MLLWLCHCHIGSPQAGSGHLHQALLQAGSEKVSSVLPPTCVIAACAGLGHCFSNMTEAVSCAIVTINATKMVVGSRAAAGIWNIVVGSDTVFVARVTDGTRAVCHDGLRYVPEYDVRIVAT